MIIAKELVGVTIQSICLKKSDTWLFGLYKGSTFIGVFWDFKTEKTKKLFEAAEDLFPKNINDMEIYEQKFGSRVTYHSCNENNYFDLSNILLENKL